MGVHAYEYTQKQKQGWAAKKVAENRRLEELRNAHIRIENERKMFLEKMSLDVDFENDSDIEEAARKCDKKFWDSLPVIKRENIKFAAKVVEKGKINPKDLDRSLQITRSVMDAYASYYARGFRGITPERIYNDFAFAKKDQEDSQQFQKRLAAFFLQRDAFIQDRPTLIEAFLKELNPEERKKFDTLAMQVFPINEAITLVGDDLLKDRQWVIKYFSDKKYIKNQIGENIALTYQKLPQDFQDDSAIAMAAVDGNNRVVQVFPVLSTKQKADKKVALFALSHDKQLTRAIKIEKVWPNFSQQVQVDEEVLENVIQATSKESTTETLLCCFTCGVAGCVRMCIDASTKRNLRDQATHTQAISNQPQRDELETPLTAAVKTAEMT